MSMELYILSDKRLAAIGDWQQAIDEDKHALRLSVSRPFNELQGALPVILNGKQTAFECDHWDVNDVMDGWQDVRFGHRWTHALAFRWGADVEAGSAAYAAAASYAKATAGIVLDCQEGAIISAKRAFEISNELGGSRAEIEAAVRLVIAKLYPEPTGE